LEGKKASACPPLSLTLRKKDLKQFKDKGGHAEAFFPSKLPLINLRMNNRNPLNCFKSFLRNVLEPISSYNILTSIPSSSLSSSAFKIRRPSGHAKFDALIEDIQNAKDYIHIQYYIFKSDGLGRRISSNLA
jgi:hypothetical protein